MKLGDMAIIRKAGDLAATSAPMPAHIKKGAIEGSYEKRIADIRPHIMAGCGCEAPPTIDKDTGLTQDPWSSEGSDGKRKVHYVDVVATHPEHAIAHCSDEDRYFRVPYSIDKDNGVTTGDSEELAQVFEPISDAPSEDEVGSADGSEGDSIS